MGILRSDSVVSPDGRQVQGYASRSNWTSITTTQVAEFNTVTEDSIFGAWSDNGTLGSRR